MGMNISLREVYVVKKQKIGFRWLWQKNRRLMEDIVSPISSNIKTIAGLPKQEELKTSYGNLKNVSLQSKRDSIDVAHPALPITQEPSSALSKAGAVLRTLILCQMPHLLRDRKYHLRQFRKCMVGSEMVDWLIQQGGPQVRIHSRCQAIGMWQALLEEGVIGHVTNEHQFKDKYLFYRFKEDCQADGMPQCPSSEEKTKAESELPETLELLLKLAPDAMFRTVLRKPLCERTVEDQEIIYEELGHIKALSHLSNSVKRELAGVLSFESHPNSGTTLFNQGDEGKSWYIILKGSVDVVIYGKGTVCSLHEGDDFGKLALMNDAPRAATIITRENNCHLLRVDKEDYNTILRDVEANTVRLKEHGQDVLVLEKKTKNGRVPTASSPSHCKFMVMSGTPQKMLEHILETRIDQRNDEMSDTFLEDFLLTHVVFMPYHQLCPELMRHYRIETKNEGQDKEFIVANKKRVVQFVQIWATTIREPFFEESSVSTFLQELLEAVTTDSQKYELSEELTAITQIVATKEKFDETLKRAPPRKWKLCPFSQIRLLSASDSQEECPNFRRSIKSNDEVVFRVYCEDHTYTTLKTTVGTTVEVIKKCAAEKLNLRGDLDLLELKSSGEKVIYKDAETSIQTGLSINGRIFLAPKSSLDTLRPLAEQEGPNECTSTLLENLNSLDLAHNMMQYEYDLFTSVHEYELLYHAFGRRQFRKITSNLDVFLRRFNEVQLWVATEVAMATTLNRRVQLFRKFIKIAQHCLECHNMNSCLAIVMGLGIPSVSRMTQTWDKIPNKVKRTFRDMESFLDPSRNHRRYRKTLEEMQSPKIPFMPLLLKDMTFAHEGNKSYMDGLVNFEKMHTISDSLKLVRSCRSRPLGPESSTSNRPQQEVRQFVRNIKVIDNPKRLDKILDMLEPRR